MAYIIIHMYLIRFENDVAKIQNIFKKYLKKEKILFRYVPN